MMNRTLCIAPMMGYTDRHYRRLIRLLTRQVLLYTEMLTTSEIRHAGNKRLLAFSPEERPIGLQLGGSIPSDLAICAKMGEAAGYDEINLNVGCPSSRVHAGRFGVCLMKTPDLVADCVDAMVRAVQIPVTVKTRIGVDEFDSEAYLWRFVETVSKAGCEVFIIHARKAWLKGLSPKENRHIPPLNYSTVYALKKAFPRLTIVINGGITTGEAIDQHLQHVDGVMIGREACRNPFLFASFDQHYFNAPVRQSTPRSIVCDYLPYVVEQLAEGERLARVTRHLHSLFQGYRGAKHWRRYLTEHAHLPEASIATIQQAMQLVALG